MDKNFLISEIRDWKAFLSEEDKPENINLLKLHAATGRPLGDDKFIEVIEEKTGRELKKRKSGPKKQ